MHCRPEQFGKRRIPEYKGIGLFPERRAVGLPFIGPAAAATFNDVGGHIGHLQRCFVRAVKDFVFLHGADKHAFYEGAPMGSGQQGAFRECGIPGSPL